MLINLFSYFLKKNFLKIKMKHTERLRTEEVIFCLQYFFQIELQQQRRAAVSLESPHTFYLLGWDQAAIICHVTDRESLIDPGILQQQTPPLKRHTHAHKHIIIMRYRHIYRRLRLLTKVTSYKTLKVGNTSNILNTASNNFEVKGKKYIFKHVLHIQSESSA